MVYKRPEIFSLIYEADQKPRGRQPADCPPIRFFRRRAASAVFIFYTNSIRGDRFFINNRNNFVNAGYDIDINRFGGLQAGLDNEGRGQA